LDRNTKFPLVVSDRGSEKGWIRYTAKEPLEWDSGKPAAWGSMFQVTNAAYVVFDDMKIRAKGALNGFLLQYSHDIRIRNCDISKWGNLGKCILEDAGHYALRWDEKTKKAIGGTWSQGIYVDRGMKRTVIERCYLHDPQARSTTWRHSHPSNVQGITMGHPDHSTVIRYCDLLGSDQHRWDDAITGKGNFSVDGGFNRTAEIYGNFLHLPNDDSIELDGGQQNVACYRNRFEGGLVGISIQGNIVSPSFVFENLVSGLGEERGEVGQTIKTSGFDIYGVSPRSWVSRNIMWGRGTGITVDVTQVPGSSPRIDCVSNVLCGGQMVTGIASVPVGSVVGNRIGVDMKAEELDPSLPERPLGFVLSAVRLDVGEEHGERKILARCRASTGPAEEFEVVKNEVFDWFEVEPKAGVIRDGMEFTVRFNEEKMKDESIYRGSFLVRMKNGLSRPVSVSATTKVTDPERCDKPGVFAEYRRPEEAKRDAEGYDCYEFTAPKDGRYYFMQFAKAEKYPKAMAAVDDEEPGRYTVQTCWKYPVWSIIHPGKPFFSSRPGRISYYDFKAGSVHTLRVKVLPGPKCETRAFAMTDSPLAFERFIEFAESESEEMKALWTMPEGKDPQTVADRVFGECSLFCELRDDSPEVPRLAAFEGDEVFHEVAGKVLVYRKTRDRSQLTDSSAMLVERLEKREYGKLGEIGILAAMARTLKFLRPEESNCRELMEAFGPMLAANREKAFKGSYTELALYTYSALLGAKRGWVGAKYAQVARKGYLELVDRTGASCPRKDAAPLLWICEELLLK